MGEAVMEVSLASKDVEIVHKDDYCPIPLFVSMLYASPQDVRHFTVALEQAILSRGGYDRADTQDWLQHNYAPGMCARTIRIPAGQVIVGEIHRHEHLNILSQGDVWVLTESNGLQHLKGPMTMTSSAGTKRALYTVTDTVWTTIHLTDERDPETMVAQITYPSYEAMEAELKGNQECLS